MACNASSSPGWMGRNARVSGEVEWTGMEAGMWVGPAAAPVNLVREENNPKGIANFCELLNCLNPTAQRFRPNRWDGVLGRR